MTLDDIITWFRIRRPEQLSTNISVHQLEAALQINLPADFIAIAKVFRGGRLGQIDLYSSDIGGPEDNIRESTIRLRNSVSLSPHFIVLAELDESFVVLDTTATEGSEQVLWCDNQDIYNLMKPEELHNPTVWHTYSDFISYLIFNDDSN